MVKPLKNKSKRRTSNSAVSVKLLGILRSALFMSLPYLLSLALVGILFGAIVATAVNSPTFELEEVRILNAGSMTQEQAFQFCELKKGENLITLDLVGVQEVIKRKHPEFKEVRVLRVLPNRVEVAVRRRTPIAQVALSKYVQIDKDLVILPGSSQVPFRNLTTIEGARSPKLGLLVGVALDDPSTKKAVRLAEAVKRSNILKNHALTKVDVSDSDNILLVVDGDLEIRIGGSHFIERLKILDQTLKTIELDRARIRYIDLRFDDVVVGPR